jgi:hypothetical protein
MTERLHREDARRIAWTKGGRLLERTLMHTGQLEAFDAFRASASRRFVMLWTRRGGKSYGGVVHAIATCIAQPGTVYKFAAPTQGMARDIVYPHAQSILSHCPEDMRPVVNRSSMTWTWPNGSTLKLAGCDGLNVDRLRGTSLDEAFVDEAGFVGPLREVIEDVLLPQTITTGGRIIMASSPPTSPAHPFADKYIPQARNEGALVHRTIYQIPHIPTAVADEYVDEAGGPESTTARREYMAEVVIDEESAIVPEFVRHRDRVVVSDATAEWRDWYVSADFGFHDLTVVLFAWYDFERARIVVEDEIAMHRASSIDVGLEIRKREAALGITPKVRVADAPAQTIADLADTKRGPGVGFQLAQKDDAEAALNVVRADISRGRLVIHPRCEVLISHLTHGVWNKARKSYERAEGYGHFDAIDALKYLCRAVNRRRNPTPYVLPSQRNIDHHIPPRPPKRTEWDRKAARQW